MRNGSLMEKEYLHLRADGEIESYECNIGASSSNGEAKQEWLVQHSSTFGDLGSFSPYGAVSAI